MEISKYKKDKICGKNISYGNLNMSTNKTNSINKKGYASLFVVLIIVSLIFVVLLLIGVAWRFEDQALQQRLNDINMRASTSAEVLKSYEITAARNSGMRATYKSAIEGGGAENHYWIIWNFLHPPTLKQAEDSISNPAITFANKYISLINGNTEMYIYSIGKTEASKQLFPLLYADSGYFKNIEVMVSPWDINPNQLDIAKCDNGFPMLFNGNNTFIIVPLMNNMSINFNNKYLEEIYPVRFWYIYRKLKKNLMVVSCNSIPVYGGCGNESKCMIYVVKPYGLSNGYMTQLMKILNNNMNNVTCTYSLLCDKSKTELIKVPMPQCQQETCWNGQVINDPSKSACALNTCDIGVGLTDCDNNESIIGPACFQNPPPPTYLYKTFPFVNQRGTYPDPNYYLTGKDCIAYGEQIILNFVANVTCVDNQYQWPLSKSGYKNLKFAFLIHVGLEHSILPPDCCEVCPTPPTPTPSTPLPSPPTPDTPVSPHHTTTPPPEPDGNT